MAAAHWNVRNTERRGRQPQPLDACAEYSNLRAILTPAMPGSGVTYRTVRSIGLSLPGVNEGLSYGGSALKYRGQLLACIATNKQAEPNSLVVRMGFADRDALLEEDPETYYLKDHYLNYPCVLVRLKRVHRDAIKDLLVGAIRFLDANHAKKRAKRSKTR
jgi:hypothetical protein